MTPGLALAIDREHKRLPAQPLHHRQPSDLPLRVTLLTTAAPVTDASRRGGSDFALPLRDRAGAAAGDPDTEGYFDASG